MFHINDLVQIRPQYATAKFKGVYRVTAVPGGNRKRYAIVNTTTSQKVDAYDIHIEAYTGGSSASLAMPLPGTVVKYKGATYVVTGSSKYGAKVALLGGGKQYTNVAVSSMEIIDPTKLLSVLAG